jgi:molybdopterin-containing oxidoreductase family membrane subunit
MKEVPMPTDRASIMGIFSTEEQTASAIRGLRNTAFTLERVHSPIPSHTIADALKLPKSKLGWFTLAGGITGFFTGFLFAAFTATRWSLIVGGKPIVALVPFVIVGFEFTILFAVIGNVLGLISQARLPRFETADLYDPRFTGHKFGILASCSTGEKSGLRHFFEAKGAEIKTDDDLKEPTGKTARGGRTT